MKLAVIKTGGKQYKVKEGLELRVERLENEVGSKFNLDDVLLISDEEGKDLQIGDPYIKDAKVEAEVVSHGRDKKIQVVKYKAKTRYKRNLGHKQHNTIIKITKIA